MAGELLAQSEREYYEYLVEQHTKGLLDEGAIALLRGVGYLAQTKQIQPPPLKSDRDWWSIVLYKYSKDNYENPTKEKWKPESVVKHTPAFYRWIDAITYGFFNQAIDVVPYVPYDWYKAQAIQWYNQINKAQTHYDTLERLEEIRLRELDRCRQNTLYFVMQYGFVKEGTDDAGRIHFVPKEHNMFIFYLLDCGYSMYLGKPRQIFMSTTMGLYALKKILLQSNFVITYVAEDAKKVEKLFKEKIKYPFGELPPWFKPTVLSDSAENFWLGEKRKKGEIDAPNSRISLTVPSPSAINSESPQLVMIDEMDNTAFLSEMILELLPTMFIDKNQDGNLQMKRQLIGWTTGVAGNKGKGAFEQEWRRIMGLWEDRNQTSGIVPIFLSWHCRCNEKHYKEQMAIYFGGKNLTQTSAFDVEANKKIFYQHYPSSFNDMFIITSNTIVSKTLIDEAKTMIRNLPVMYQPVAGYFEPVYDTTIPSSEFADVPYKIIDAIFIPCNDDEMELTTAWRLVPPNYEWIDRYYQGTDPISETTGHSKFASSIWDKLLQSEQKEDTKGGMHYKVTKPKAPVCILNFRRQHDNNYCFLQSVLMGLYYDTNNRINNKQGIPELIEANIGTNYCGYKERLGFSKHLVYNSQLPDKLRGGARIIGIDNKSTRFSEVINKLRECVKENYNAIKFNVVFDQLQTFVEKAKSSNFTWEALDKKIHFDDVLFALTYSYICAEYCFDHKTPKKVADDKKTKAKVYYPLSRDNNGMLQRKAHLKQIA